MLRQEIQRRNLVEEGEMSDCGESPDVPADPAPSQPHRRLTARGYHLLFCPVRSLEPPVGNDDRGKGPAQDDDEDE